VLVDGDEEDEVPTSFHAHLRPSCMQLLQVFAAKNVDL
jgi:hypothetical protein